MTDGGLGRLENSDSFDEFSETDVPYHGADAVEFLDYGGDLDALGNSAALVVDDVFGLEIAEREACQGFADAVDVAGGDDIPRKRGPGVVRCDLLVVNKIDLAPHVGVDLERMLAEAGAVRQGKPILATNARSGEGVELVADAIGRAVLFDR